MALGPVRKQLNRVRGGDSQVWNRILCAGMLDVALIDRDRGTPRDATPPTPPGIRVPYHGGSTKLGLGGRIDLGKTEGLEIVVA